MTRPDGVPGTLRHFIGGEDVDSASGRTFETADPVTNEPYAAVVAGDAEERHGVNLRVHHQFVGRVLGDFGAHIVPGAAGLDDSLHRDRVVARRRSLEGRQELGESDAGEHIHPRHAVHMSARIGRHATTPRQPPDPGR